MDSTRAELYACIEQSAVAKQDNLTPEEVLALPAEKFPTECEALRKAFDEFAKAAGEKKSQE